jgi:hypothetical protein
MEELKLCRTNPISKKQIFLNKLGKLRRMKEKRGILRKGVVEIETKNEF